MITKSSVLAITHWSERQLRDYVDVGIFPHPQRKRRQDGVYPDNSKEYIRIIQQMPRDYNEIALELFLQGYPVRPSILRDALVMHFQRRGQLQQHIHTHTDRKEWTPVKERDALHRYVTRQLSDGQIDTIEADVPMSDKIEVTEAAFQWERGVPGVRNKKGFGLPSVDDQALAQRVANADDEQLARARQTSHALLLQRRKDINTFFIQVQDFSTPQEMVGWFLDGHTCPYHHTYIQALRPLFLAYALQPASDDELEGLIDFCQNVSKAYTPVWLGMVQSKHYARP